MKDITNALRLLCQLQSVTHTIDELSDSVHFKHDIKQRTNNYLKTVDKLLNDLQRGMDIEEIENYSKIVNELDKLVATIEITKDETI